MYINKYTTLEENWSPTFVWYDTERLDDEESNDHSIVTCVFVAAGK
jgi:hypothetical protein